MKEPSFGLTHEEQKDYLAFHVVRIERSRLRRLVNDSLYRIASHCCIKGLGDKLTTAQTQEIELFISQFKAKYSKLIEKYRNEEA